MFIAVDRCWLIFCDLSKNEFYSLQPLPVFKKKNSSNSTKTNNTKFYCKKFNVRPPWPHTQNFKQSTRSSQYAAIINYARYWKRRAEEMFISNEQNNYFKLILINSIIESIPVNFVIFRWSPYFSYDFLLFFNLMMISFDILKILKIFRTFLWKKRRFR